MANGTDWRAVLRQDPIRAGLADRALPRWATPVIVFLLLYATSLIVNLTFGALHGFRSTLEQLDADEAEYIYISRQILDGTLELSGRRTLGFPLAIAGISAIRNNLVFVQIVVSALYALSAPFLSLAAARVTRSRLYGAVCGLALALWPSGIFFGTSLYSETLALPVFLLALYFLPPGSRVDRRAKPPAVRDAVICGVLLGITAQIRPMYLLFLPFLLVAIVLEEERLRVAARRFAIVVAAFLLPVLPWSIYFTVHFHHPLILTSNGGETLSGGLNPKLLETERFDRLRLYNRDTWNGPGKWLPVMSNGYLSPQEQALPYDRMDRLLKQRTIAWVTSHPSAAAYLELRKIAYMWGIYPLFDNGMAQMLFGNLPVQALLVIGLTALIALPASRTRLARFWVLPFFTSAVALISWGSWRFRQPGDAGLLAFCVICLLAIAASRRPRIRAEAA